MGSKIASDVLREGISGKLLPLLLLLVLVLVAAAAT